MSPSRRRLASRPAAAELPSNIVVLDDHTHALQLLHKLENAATARNHRESARRYAAAAKLLSAIDIPPTTEGETLAGVGPKERR